MKDDIILYTYIYSKYQIQLIIAFHFILLNFILLKIFKFGRIYINNKQTLNVTREPIATILITN